MFETNKLPNAVNGSLWSLPVEFLMYIIVEIVGFLRGNRWTFIALAVISAAIAFFWAQRSSEMIVVYASDLRQVFICGSYFWFGAVFYKFNLQRYFSISTVVIAVVIMMSLESWLEALSLCAYLLLPMVVLAFGLAYSPTLNWLTRSGDYSYGIYIYAFPIQQSIIYLYPNMTLKLYLPICLVLTLICAILSWHFVESPALAFKPRKFSAN